MSLPTGFNTRAFLTALNSTIAYILTYMFAQGVYQAATVLMARRLGIPGVWYTSEIIFKFSDADWWRMAVLTVCGVGPAVCAVIGLVALIWFWFGARQQPGLLKLTLLWLMLHGCNLVLGSLVGDTMLKTWSWHVPNTLFMAGNVINGFMALLAAIVQVAIGYSAAIAFLQSHDSITLVKYSNRAQLVSAGIWAPWLLGSLLLILLKVPNITSVELLHFLMMGVLLLLPMAVRCRQEIFEWTPPRSQKPQFAWGLLALTVLVVAAWHLVLAPGLKF